MQAEHVEKSLARCEIKSVSVEQIKWQEQRQWRHAGTAAPRTRQEAELEGAEIQTLGWRCFGRVRRRDREHISQSRLAQIGRQDAVRQSKEDISG